MSRFIIRNADPDYAKALAEALKKHLPRSSVQLVIVKHHVPEIIVREIASDEGQGLPLAMGFQAGYTAATKRSEIALTDSRAKEQMNHAALT